MNLFQYKTYLHAYVPRIHTPDGIKQVQVPWAREESGFALLYEAFILSMAQVTSVMRIHLKVFNDVLDNIRRREHRENIPRFNKIRYHLLKDPKKLKKNQRERLDDFLTQASLDTVKAYNLVQMFKKGYEYQRPS